MGDAFAEGDSCARWGIKGFVAVRDACRALQNNDMLVLILMNVHRRAVTRVRDDFDNRIFNLNEADYLTISGEC
jgi:hypothetical protein